MSDEGTPCWETGIDPDDWFISRDGKQYPDDEFLTEVEKANIARSVLPKADETEDEHTERVDRAIRAAVADRRRAALQRRRKAREACYDCPVRLQCLDLALEGNIQHGTWGGYYEEEIREIRREIKRRRGREA